MRGPGPFVEEAEAFPVAARADLPGSRPAGPKTCLTKRADVIEEIAYKIQFLREGDRPRGNADG